MKRYTRFEAFVYIVETVQYFISGTVYTIMTPFVVLALDMK
jgi:hypothetical protein